MVPDAQSMDAHFLKTDPTQAGSCFVRYPDAVGACVDFPVHTDYIKPTEPTAISLFQVIKCHCVCDDRQWQAVLQAKNEVKVLNSLNHPNIVKYYECYQERNMMHIIMEFCQVTPAWVPMAPCCACCSSSNLSCPHELLLENASLTKPKSFDNVASHWLRQGCGLVGA